jgi:hypothetical protein
MFPFSQFNFNTVQNSTNPSLKKSSLKKPRILHSLQFESTRSERDKHFSQNLAGIPGACFLKTTIEGMQYGTGRYEALRHVSEAIVWDEELNHFVLRGESYYSTTTYKEPKEKRAVEQGLVGRLTLDNGIFVDNPNKRLIFPDGRWIDGVTGEHYTVHGEPLSQLPVQAKGNKEV